MTDLMTTAEIDQTTAIIERVAGENVTNFGMSYRDGFLAACARFGEEHPEVYLYWGIALISRKANGVAV